LLVGWGITTRDSDRETGMVAVDPSEPIIEPRKPTTSDLENCNSEGEELISG